MAEIDSDGKGGLVDEERESIVKWDREEGANQKHQQSVCSRSVGPLMSRGQATANYRSCWTVLH